jgi:hypothetical protein
MRKIVARLGGALACAAAVAALAAVPANAQSASTGGHTATAAKVTEVRPMDGPPGTVWTGKKFWTLTDCTAAGTDLVASGHWADPFCDGSGLMYDLWARPV